MHEERYIWNEYISGYSITKSLSGKRNQFLDLFEQKWSDFFSDFSFDLCQLNTGNRLRPQIAFLGFLANETDFDKIDLDFIVDIGISIELIHKSSLLLDDMLDNDVSRHNEPTFHIVNGNDKTVLFALHLLSKALLKLKDTLLFNKKQHSVFRKCIELSIQVLYDMSLGVVSESSLDKKSIFEVKRIKDIIQLETGTLIKSSLLLGYCSNGGCNPKVEELFVKIGNACGYIFQAMNDLEPFCNCDKNMLHKGSINSDYINHKKNIAIAFLYERMSEVEKEELDSIDVSKTNEVYKVLFNNMERYNVVGCFMTEVDEVISKILILIDEVKQQNVNELWCNHFKEFISLLAKAAKSRLQ